jgi:hypothetical protein
LSARAPRPTPRALLACGLVLALAGASCAKRDTPEEARARTRKVFLQNQLKGLEDLVAKAERGETVTADQIAISVDEDVARELLNASLPQEKVLGGRVRVRIEKVEPYFRGTQGALLFHARATSEDFKGAFADLELAGGLEDLALREGKLSARVSLVHFTVLNSSVGPLVSLVESLVRDHLHDLERIVPPFEIPVRLDQTIQIGGLREGPVSVVGGRLPLSLTVSQVLQINKRLWVLIDAKAGPWEAAREAPPEGGS